MLQLATGDLVKNFPLTLQQVKLLENIPCDACHKAKAKRLSFPKASTTEVHAPLQRLHLDLMGPFFMLGACMKSFTSCVFLINSVALLQSWP